MPKKLPKIITQEEFEKIFTEAKRLRDVNTGRRKKVFQHKMVAMLLGFEGGMRISEIVGLKEAVSKCCDANLDIKYIKKEKDEKKIMVRSCSKCKKKVEGVEIIRARDDRWRVPRLTKSMVSDNSIRIKGKGEKDRIVPRPRRFNSKARDGLPLIISRRSLQKFVTDLGHNILKREITFHTLRHGFASHLAGSDRPLHEIQMLLGHARLDTTGIYLHANPAKAIKEALDVF